MTDRHPAPGWNNIADHYDRIRHLVNADAEFVPATATSPGTLHLGGIQATLRIDHYGVTHIHVHTGHADDALRQTADGRLPVQLDIDGHSVAHSWPGPGGQQPGAGHLAEITADDLARHTTMPAATIVYGTANGPLPRTASTGRVREVVRDTLQRGGRAHVLPTGLITVSNPGRGDATIYPNPAAQQPRCRHCGSWSTEHIQTSPSPSPSPCPGFEPMTSTDSDTCVRCDQPRAEHSWRPTAACDHFTDDPWWDDDDDDQDDDLY